MFFRISLLLITFALTIGCDRSTPTAEPAAPVPGVVQEAAPERTWAFAFAIDTQDGQSAADVRRAAESVFADIVTVEPLFPEVKSNDDPFGLSRIYLLHANEPRSVGNSWDFAYELQERGGFAKVEPDSDSALAEANARMAIANCQDDAGVPAPDDPGWSLRKMKLEQAWALPLPADGRAMGEGVRICHPDTGWTDHVEIDAAQIDITSTLNLIEGGTNALDPLGYSGNPGHGTSTGSVLISSGGIDPTAGTLPPGTVTGVAPRATLVPIRAIKSVIQVLDSDIARAVRHSVEAKCDVISMSLGGGLFFGLKRAIDDAVNRDVVVVAASGNCVGFVVAPASYDAVIAVAATNDEQKPWRGSSKGRAIDISAPGEDIYVARAEAGVTPGVLVESSDGTSFATTAIAGAAADWIAFHGHDAIKQAQGSLTRRDLFLQLMRASAERPTYSDPTQTWDDTRYGPGIVNVEDLLKQPLGAPRNQLRSPFQDDAIALLSRMFDLPPDQVRAGLSRMFNDPVDLDAELQRTGGELLELATRDPDTFRNALKPSSTDALAIDATGVVKARASRTLSAQLDAAPSQ